MYYHSKTIKPVIGQYKSADITDYFSFHFDCYALDRRLLLGLSCSYHSGWTDFSVDTPTWGGRPPEAAYWIGNGSSGTTIYRAGLKVGYNLLNVNSRLRLSPELMLIFERSKATDGFSERAYIDIRADDYYEGPISLLPLNSFQVLPALGFDLDWNFWWRLHFVYSTYYAWGHKPFQKYYFEYTY